MVSSASASALTAAITHLMRIVFIVAPPLTNDAIRCDLVARAAGDQHERPIAGRPDGRFMTEHLDELLRGAHASAA